MNDWIKQYGDNKGARKFQEGGAIPAQGTPAAPATPAEGQEGGQPLDQMLAQYAQSRDPQLAVAICDSLVEMMAQQQGGAQMAKCGTKMKRGGKKGPIFTKVEEPKGKDTKKDDKSKK